MATLPLTVATIFGLGTGELVVIFLIVLLLFGGANLPKLTRSLGKSIKEFKKAVKDSASDMTEEEAEVRQVTAGDPPEAVPAAPEPAEPVEAAPPKEEG